jgi:hypothetical protein
VKALSTDPAAKPEISPITWPSRLTADALLAAMKYLRRLLATKPLSDYVIREEFPRPRRADRRAMDGGCPRHRLDHLSPGRHLQIGTDPLAVVDPASMRVLGLQGLRVADASCMPTMVSGNNLRRHQHDRRESVRPDPTRPERPLLSLTGNGPDVATCMHGCSAHEKTNYGEHLAADGPERGGKNDQALAMIVVAICGFGATSFGCGNRPKLSARHRC